MDQKTKPNIIATVWRGWKNAFKNNAVALSIAFVGYNLAPYFTAMLKPSQWKIACDQLISGGNPWPAFTMIVICVSASYLLKRVAHWALIFAESRIIKDLRDNVLSGILKKNYSFFKNTSIGGLISKSKRFANYSEDTIDHLIFAITPSFFLVLYLVTYSFYTIPNIAPIFLVWVLVFVLVTYIFSGRRMKLDLEASEQDSKTMSFFSSIVSSVSYLRSFASTPKKYADFQKRTEKEMNATRRAWICGEYQWAIQDFLMIAIEIIVMYQMVVAVQNKTETIGTVVMVQVYISSLTSSMFNFGQSFFRLRTALASSYEMAQILDDSKTEDEGETHLIPQNGIVLDNNSITMSNVDFTFDSGKDSEQTVIRDFSFHFLGGKHYGVVGESGSGKSTLVNVLLGFLHVQKGDIHIGTVPCSYIPKHCLREHIAYVPQKPEFPNGTVRSIITLGNIYATEKEIINAINKSHCNFVFENFPKGLETEVGERGVKLSGGQAQRLAICAAILKDAPIVIMDEPTSALDAETEQVIQEAIKFAFHGKTLILIAHRLATVALLDEIIVVKNGSFVTSGHHNELLQNNPYYKHVWDLQTNPNV
ncbi:MAG: ABC transporter ATP-binding protein [Minisyncoccia bacterium]